VLVVFNLYSKTLIAMSELEEFDAASKNGTF